jgi:glycine cleavage system H lipoate-binding protein
VVALELAAEGATLRAGDGLGFVTLGSRIVDLRAPFALRIVARNAAALADPRLLRDSPYRRGWLIEFERL